jgi:hypothetical protein
MKGSTGPGLLRATEGSWILLPRGISSQISPLASRPFPNSSWIRMRRGLTRVSSRHVRGPENRGSMHLTLITWISLYFSPSSSNWVSN